MSDATPEQARPSEIQNWELVFGMTWWVVESPYGHHHRLAHVGIGGYHGRLLCGLPLPTNPIGLLPTVQVCGNCERVLVSYEETSA